MLAFKSFAAPSTLQKTSAFSGKNGIFSSFQMLCAAAQKTKKFVNGGGPLCWKKAAPPPQGRGLPFALSNGLLKQHHKPASNKSLGMEKVDMCGWNCMGRVKGAPDLSNSAAPICSITSTLLASTSPYTQNQGNVAWQMSMVSRKEQHIVERCKNGAGYYYGTNITHSQCTVP